ncbi:pyrimidine reductase family protein [Agromyces sp. SYSU K20354]|uniref:pyrimidine reductase family protein n=1 Tax=Agromyces cavernae TaxID=2898659 RepID=UPI001E4D3527|nr:pyrimidine reductase family protein [Agromyces cavernae]MCD2444273.1 pyrimidine reductase family protein [Agromyces cavernae]
MTAAPAGLAREELLAAYAIEDRATPRVRMNFVMSLDGAVTLDGRSGGLGNADDRRIMGVLRALADVILVGAGTVRVEGYGGVRLPDEVAAWRTGRGMAAQPPLAVVSSRLDLAPGHPFFTDATVRPIVVTHSAAPADRRAALAEVADMIVSPGDAVDLRHALAALADRGLPQVLCEGGPHLFGALLAADLVDELCLSLSSVLVAGDAGRIAAGAEVPPRRMRLVHELPTDEMLFLRYARG